MLVAEEAVEIRVLRRQGKSIREIARLLDVSGNTVRRYLRSEGLARYERGAQPSKLREACDPHRICDAARSKLALLQRVVQGNRSYPNEYNRVTECYPEDHDF
jgi:transposase